MSFLDIEKIIKDKVPFIETIDVNQLGDSGTGYYHSILHDKTINFFIDKYGRKGYLFQLEILHIATKDKIDSSFVIHQRYCDDENTICFHSPEIFCNDCRVRNEQTDKFIKRFKSLINGEKIPQWNQEDEKYEIYLKPF
jgi:hypothetical protein